MAVDKIHTAIWDVIKQRQNVYITTPQIKSWLNDAQRDLATRLRILRKTTTAIAIDDVAGTIAIPADFLEAIGLKLSTDTYDAQPVNDETFLSWKQNALTPPKTIFRVLQTTIEFYPLPAVSATAALRYAYTPADLSSG